MGYYIFQLSRDDGTNPNISGFQCLSTDLFVNSNDEDDDGVG